MSKAPFKNLGQSRINLNFGRSISFLDRRIAYVPIGKKVRLNPRKKMVRH